MVTETFGEPDYVKLLTPEGKELQLADAQKWTIWEKREFLEQKGPKLQSEEQFMANCKKIAWFDNIIQFHLAWKKIPHSVPSKILYDS